MISRLQLDKEKQGYDRVLTIIHYGWRARFVWFVVVFLIVAAGVMMSVLAWIAFFQYGLVENGMLAPLWQRSLISFVILCIPALMTWGVVLYLQRYVVELVICTAPKLSSLPKKRIIIKTMTLLGFHSFAVKHQDLCNLRYHEGGNWVNGVERRSQVNAPYFLFNVKGYHWPFIVDTQSGGNDFEKFVNLF